MTQSLHPTEGIRLLLERSSMSEDKSVAEYLAWVYTVTESFSYQARLGLDGSCELASLGGAEATDEDAGQLLRIAKSTARAAKRKLQEELPPWPPRVLRWRGPGRGS